MPEKHIGLSTKYLSRCQKRLRDREAQRAHRSRQRSYVERLEAQIKLYKDQPEQKQVVKLWADNERLRRQVGFITANFMPRINVTFFFLLGGGAYIETFFNRILDKERNQPVHNSQAR
jgi:hypothetical protein